jgi:hypothetical protein
MINFLKSDMLKLWNYTKKKKTAKPGLEWFNQYRAPRTPASRADTKLFHALGMKIVHCFLRLVNMI